VAKTGCDIWEKWGHSPDLFLYQAVSTLLDVTRDCAPYVAGGGLDHAACSGPSGLTSRSTDTWLTIAHELGHNFGGRHTFEEGGRMSYTRDTPFVPVPNDICAGITAAIEETPECMQFEQAACGNGQLESGEECDDGNEVSDDGCSADCTVECRHVSLSHPEVAGSNP